MSRPLATRYARALFELGSEAGGIEVLLGHLETLATTYRENEELQDVLENPMTPHEARRAILAEIAERGAVGPVAKNTLLLLADRRRVRLLPAIAKRLREMVDVSRGVVHAEVVTAVALNDAFYERLRAQLERTTGKRVVLDRREDPSLLAGVVTRIGDTVYDGSLRARLDAMRGSLVN